MNETSELRNIVYQIFEDTDYNLYFKAFDEENYSACVILAESYMEKARDKFFASLEDDICDTGKAMDFHSSYKIFEKSLEYAARQLETRGDIIISAKDGL